MTARETRRYLSSADLGMVRRRCGISQGVIAQAVGAGAAQVSNWERGRWLPRGERAERYARVIAGLRRHLEVPGE